MTIDSHQFAETDQKAISQENTEEQSQQATENKKDAETLVRKSQDILKKPYSIKDFAKHSASQNVSLDDNSEKAPDCSPGYEHCAQENEDELRTFEEESHKYTMLDDKGDLRSDFPSVSKVMKLFYEEFPTEQAAFSKAGGDPDEAERLMEEWAEAGRKSTNLGSRCHFFLEEHTLKEFGIDKAPL